MELPTALTFDYITSVSFFVNANGICYLIVNCVLCTVSMVLTNVALQMMAYGINSFLFCIRLVFNEAYICIYVLLAGIS